MGKSKEISQDLRKKIGDLHKSGSSLGDIFQTPEGTTFICQTIASINTMGPHSRHTTQERDAFCLLDMYFGVKSANQSQNNSKGPCEDAGGHWCKSIYIRHKKARLRFATAHGDEDHTFWRNVLWSDETKK